MIEITINDETDKVIKELFNSLKKISQKRYFINKNNCEGINFLSEKDDWKKYQKNNVAIALNVLYDKKEISCVCFRT